MTNQHGLRGAAQTLACVVLLFGVFGAASCSSESGGPGDANPDSGTGDSPGQGWGEGACAACVQTTCATELQTCGQDPTCAAHWSCLRACPTAPSGDVDDACEAACPKAGGSAAEAAIGALVECRGTGPGAACGECGGVPADSGADSDAGCTDHPLLCQSCTPSADPNPCFKCEDENCCESWATCKNDTVCDAYVQCMKACTLPTFRECVGECDVQVPGGFPKFNRRLTCVFVHCPGADTCGDSEPCATCISQSCPNESVACELNESCARLGLCIGTCAGSSACIDDCNAQFPDGTALKDKFFDCVTIHCVDACN